MSVYVSKCVFVWVCVYVLVYLYVGNLGSLDPGPWDKNKNIALVWFFFISLCNYFYICVFQRRPRDFSFLSEKVTVFVSFKMKNVRYQGCLIYKISAAQKRKRADFRLHLTPWPKQCMCVHFLMSTCLCAHCVKLKYLVKWWKVRSWKHKNAGNCRAVKIWKVYDLVWTPGLWGFLAYAFPPIRCSNKHSFC